MKPTELKKVTAYYCPFCKKYFRTANRHFCILDPAMKSCPTCDNIIREDGKYAMCSVENRPCYTLLRKGTKPNGRYTNKIYNCESWKEKWKYRS